MSEVNKSIMIPNHSYKNMELNIFDVLICISSLTFSIFNVLLGMFMIPLIILSEVKHFHKNFCIIHFNIIIGYLFIAIACFFAFFLKLCEMKFIPINAYGIFYHSIIMASFGVDLLRCLWISVFIERTFATVYYRTYEKTRFMWISNVLVVVSYIVSIVINYMKFNKKGPLTYFYAGYCAMSIIDIFGAFSIHVLTKYNRKIRKINARSDIKLNQRYQLAENIQAIKLMLPFLVFGSCLTLFGTVNIWLALTDFFFNWFRYTANIYYNLFNIYICVVLIICIRHDVLNDSSLSSMYYKCIHRKKHIRTAPMLRNTEGQQMGLNETIDAHFMNLNEMWK